MYASCSWPGSGGGGGAASTSIRPSTRWISSSHSSATAGSWVASRTIGAPVGLHPQLADHQVAVGLVELAGGLVGEQHVGLQDERAGDGDALELAAGQLGDQPVGELVDADPGQRLGRPSRWPPTAATPRPRSAMATFSGAVSVGTRP